nr:hypothetical protein [Mimivirus sp.]
MNKDPEYFLQKARHFYNKAKNNIINEIDSNDEFSEIDSDNDLEIYSDNEFTSNVNPIYNTIRDEKTDYGKTDDGETDDGETDDEETDDGETDDEETDYEPETIDSDLEYEYIKLEPINIENLIDEKLKKYQK